MVWCRLSGLLRKHHRTSHTRSRGLCPSLANPSSLPLQYMCIIALALALSLSLSLSLCRGKTGSFLTLALIDPFFCFLAFFMPRVSVVSHKCQSGQWAYISRIKHTANALYFFGLFISNKAPGGIIVTDDRVHSGKLVNHVSALFFVPRYYASNSKLLLL